MRTAVSLCLEVDAKIMWTSFCTLELRTETINHISIINLTDQVRLYLICFPECIIDICRNKNKQKQALDCKGKKKTVDPLGIDPRTLCV